MTMKKPGSLICVAIPAAHVARGAKRAEIIELSLAALRPGSDVINVENACGVSGRIIAAENTFEGVSPENLKS
jgi:predicted methyltransferase